MKKYITIENAELFVSSTLQAVGTEPEIAMSIVNGLSSVGMLMLKGLEPITFFLPLRVS